MDIANISEVCFCIVKSVFRPNQKITACSRVRVGSGDRAYECMRSVNVVLASVAPNTAASGTVVPPLPTRTVKHWPPPALTLQGSNRP